MSPSAQNRRNSVTAGNTPPDLVRKTHTRKDGSFIDAPAQSLVLIVEEAVTKMIANDGSSNSASKTTSTAATPSRILLNQELIKDFSRK